MYSTAIKRKVLGQRSESLVVCLLSGHLKMLDWVNVWQCPKVHHSSSYPRKVQLWAYFKPDGIVFFFFSAPLNFVQSKALGQGHYQKKGNFTGPIGKNVTSPKNWMHSVQKYCFDFFFPSVWPLPDPYFLQQIYDTQACFALITFHVTNVLRGAHNMPVTCDMPLMPVTYFGSALL